MATFEQNNAAKRPNGIGNGYYVISSVFPLADIPEPNNFSVEFSFQGFEISQDVQTRLSEFQSVTINFDTIVEAPPLSDFTLIGNQGTTILSPIDLQSLISYNNSDKFQSELLSAQKVSSIFLQDNFASDTAAELIENISIGLGVDIFGQSLSDGASAISIAANDISTGYQSSRGIDVIEGIAIDTNISDNVVAAMVAEQSLRNESEVSTSDFGVSLLGKIAEKSHAAFLDNRIINEVAEIAGKNPFGPFSAALGADSIDSSEYTPLQNDARQDFVDGGLDAEDYEFIVRPINNFVADNGEISEVKMAGYIIEKFEVTPDGRIQEVEPFIFSSNDTLPGQTVTINDPEVILGNVYTYVLSSLAIFKVRDVNNLEAGDLEDIEIIVKSRPQILTLVAGTQFPDPPTDINYYYDYEREDLMIVWDFPLTDQTSLIKKFQIFRRESINDPYTLIRQYDFDDSESPVEQIDDVDFGLNVKLKEPLTFYIDEDFKKDKEYIYSICSISSEGASSQYSTQTSVRFSTAKNDLVMKKISQSGAPKPYPNFYVEQELDVDIMRVSKANAMTIFFDPDVFNLNIPADINTDGIIDPEEVAPTQFMVTNRIGGKYVMQLINLDLLKEQRFEITIDDKSNLVLDLAGS